ncbi:mandelate racemase/muconate lactonizing enzyme family protein [Aliamphritea spongicola]|uniref:mandelate racemase/muconate lactonizing enzyme family protein n=1 Tax=Aliamphritea spongicola TaxID=707589 RepID=UPI00196B4BEF|nr:mandelate racemase/muconate lactonizing enzyme family protein [Aliamphritea spongicola]MBN3562314.1 mandelate racemase/muconate lactonizing enzyme family protein [Aliamphritea spongicola]
MSVIVDLEAIIVSVPAEGNAFAEGAEETVLVKVTDAEGRYGIGECVATPSVTKAMIDMPTVHFWSQGIKEHVIGREPVEARAIYDAIYHSSFYHGRRGILIHALSAVDIALYDLAGKQLGLPVYKLLGGARCNSIRPYATIYPGDIYDGPLNTIVSELEKQARIAVDQGLRSVKVPILFGEHLSDRKLVGFIEDCRRMVGDDIKLSLDFGYRWRDWQDAAWLLKRIDDCRIAFAEAPLWHDDLHGHRKLAEVSPVKVGGAEFAVSRWEVRDWLETGGVSLVQPGISRAGGFTELMRIAEMCEMYGASLIPHSYATGITDICNIHLQAACLTIPMVEFRSSRLGPSRLRTELVSPAEPDIKDGLIALPDAPGLGITLNEALVSQYGIR